MPVYEFACSKCGEQLEVLVKLGTKTVKCPVCGKNMLKQMSTSNFHLPGHFWYKDGYGLHPNTKSKKGDKNNGAQGI